MVFQSSLELLYLGYPQYQNSKLFTIVMLSLAIRGPALWNETQSWLLVKGQINIKYVNDSASGNKPEEGITLTTN